MAVLGGRHSAKATLSRIENGRANPTVETLNGLARALRVPLTELLEDPPPEMRVIRQTRSRLESGDGLAQGALDALTVAGGEPIEVPRDRPAGRAPPRVRSPGPPEVAKTYWNKTFRSDRLTEWKLPFYKEQATWIGSSSW